jgi:hypothetical protein
MKELAAIVKIWKDISLFAAAFIRVPFGSMTYDGYSCSLCGEEIRLNPRKFRA